MARVAVLVGGVKLRVGQAIEGYGGGARCNHADDDPNNLR
jgi:hypothetical protein